MNRLGAQVGNLLFRRLAVGSAVADYQSAMQQTGSLRFPARRFMVHRELGSGAFLHRLPAHRFAIEARIRCPGETFPTQARSDRLRRAKRIDLS